MQANSGDVLLLLQVRVVQYGLDIHVTAALTLSGFTVWESTILRTSDLVRMLTSFLTTSRAPTSTPDQPPLPGMEDLVSKQP